jgi:hypothetical protein
MNSQSRPSGTAVRGRLIDGAAQETAKASLHGSPVQDQAPTCLTRRVASQVGQHASSLARDHELRDFPATDQAIRPGRAALPPGRTDPPRPAPHSRKAVTS